MSTNLTRRELMNLTAGGFAAWISAPVRLRPWHPRMAVFSPAGKEPQGDVLVVVFQRGGMDALNAVVPHFEPAYYNRRPTLAIPEPASGEDNAAIDLDGKFGLHPPLRA